MNRLHERLHRACDELGDRHLTLADVFALHGQATQGALLVLLAVPCLLPLPGTGTVMALGIAALAWTMWQGHERCGLPERVADVTLPPHSAQRVLRSLAWFYMQAGRWTRTRMIGLTGPVHRHWMALWVAAMSLLIFLPIPFGNVLPAVGLLLFGLGLVYQDGLAVLSGVVVGLVALAITTVLGLWAIELGSLGLSGNASF